jgi:hypothetical protein
MLPIFAGNCAMDAVCVPASMAASSSGLASKPIVSSSRPDDVIASIAPVSGGPQAA